MLEGVVFKIVVLNEVNKNWEIDLLEWNRTAV